MEREDPKWDGQEKTQKYKRAMKALKILSGEDSTV